jgi:hypothetical protein
MVRHLTLFIFFSLHVVILFTSSFWFYCNRWTLRPKLQHELLTPYFNRDIKPIVELTKDVLAKGEILLAVT